MIVVYFLVASLLAVAGIAWEELAPEAAGDLWVPLLAAAMWWGMVTRDRLGPGYTKVVGITVAIFMLYKVARLLLVA